MSRPHGYTATGNNAALTEMESKKEKRKVS
jgi:hypothetical protein